MVEGGSDQGTAAAEIYSIERGRKREESACPSSSVASFDQRSGRIEDHLAAMGVFG